MTEEHNQNEVRNYADEIGVTGVNLSIAKQVVQLCWHDGHVPLFIGESGTGKTHGVQQLAQYNDMEMKPIHLGNVDSSDIKGPPFPQPNGTFKYLTPSGIPVEWTPTTRQKRLLHRAEKQGVTREEITSEEFDFDSLENFEDDDLDVLFQIKEDIEKSKEEKILFFDELNRSSKDGMNAAMSVWKEDLLGDAKLGPNVRVAAAMNPPGGSYAVNSQITTDPAMRRRFCQMVVNFSQSELLRYAEEPEKQALSCKIPELDFEEMQERDEYRPWHSTVVGYIRQNPNNAMDRKSRQAGRVYACPPGWEEISDTMYTVERLDLNLDDAVIQQVVKTKLAGHIGWSSALDFLDFYEQKTDVIDPVDVLYNYEPKTAVWKKVQNKLNGSEYLGLQNVLESSIRYIFDPEDDDFDMEDVVPQLGRIINDLPANLAQDILVHVSDVSQEIHGGYNSDVRKLMTLLNNDENFEEFNKRSLEMSLEQQEEKAEAQAET